MLAWVCDSQAIHCMTRLTWRVSTGTQETAVTLVGLMLGMLCAQSLAANAHHSMALFLVLTGIHVWANYRAVYALHVESVNPSRGHLLATEILSLPMLRNSPPPESCANDNQKSRLLGGLSSNDKLSIAYVRAHNGLMRIVTVF